MPARTAPVPSRPLMAPRRPSVEVSQESFSRATMVFWSVSEDGPSWRRCTEISSGMKRLMYFTAPTPRKMMDRPRVTPRIGVYRV